MKELSTQNRLFRETLLIWLVLIITMWNFARFWTLTSWKGVLGEFTSRAQNDFMLITSGAWTILGVFCLVAIWRREKWSGSLIVISALAYSIFYWMERILLQQPHPNWQFAVILNLIIITFVLFTRRS